MPTLCLNMIVKNEGKIIERMLSSVKDYIDYWVIVDTGSTDDTKEKITKFFANTGIKGELYEHEWKDFGYNRTKAIELAKGKADYILLMDADMILRVKNPKFKDNLNCDRHLLTLTFNYSFLFDLVRIVKGNLDHDFVGRTHEYPRCQKKDCTQSRIPMKDVHIFDIQDGASRTSKYERDIKYLLMDLEDDPSNTRTIFYLARSYFFAKDFENAIKYYEKRISSGGWKEEIFISYLEIAASKSALNKNWDEIENCYNDAAKCLPERAPEAIIFIAEHYRKLQNPTITQLEKVYSYAKQCLHIPFPNQLELFLDRTPYDYRIIDELSCASFALGKYMEAFYLCTKLLNCPILPESYKVRVSSNREYAKKELEKLEPITILLYFSSSIPDEISDFANLYGDYITIYVYGPQNDNVSNVLYVDDEFINGSSFDYVIVYNYINYFYKKIHPTTNNLFVCTGDFKLLLQNGIVALMNDNNLTKTILDNTTRIMCQNEQMKVSLLLSHNIPAEIISTINVQKFTDLIFEIILNNYEKIKNIKYDKVKDEYIRYAYPKKLVDLLKKNMTSQEHKLIKFMNTSAIGEFPYDVSKFGSSLIAGIDLIDETEDLSKNKLIKEYQASESKTKQHIQDSISISTKSSHKNDILLQIEKPKKQRKHKIHVVKI